MAETATDTAAPAPAPKSAFGHDPETKTYDSSPLSPQSVLAEQKKIYGERQKTMESQQKTFDEQEAALKGPREDVMKTLTPVDARAQLQKIREAPNPEDYKKYTMEFMSSMALVGAFMGHGSRNSGNAALKAFSGAMKGWREGNQQAYHDAKDQWEENTKATIANNNIEIEKYKEITENHQLNTHDMLLKLNLASVPFKNRAMNELTKMENLDGSMKLIDSMVRANEKLIGARDELTGLDEQPKARALAAVTDFNADPVRAAAGTNYENYIKLKGTADILHQKDPNFPLLAPLPEGAHFAGKQATPGISVKPGEKPDLTSLGWSQRAIDDAAVTFNETGVFPTNLGSRQYAGIISGVIRDRAAELRDESGISITQRSHNWQRYKAQQYGMNRVMGGPFSNTVTALDVVVQHLDTLRQLSEALHNNDYRAFNTAAQLWARQTGKPAPTNFDQARQIVGPEVVKAIGVAGAGTGAERAGAIIADPSSPPDVVDGAMDTLDQLLVGQLRGKRQQFKSTTRGTDAEFDEFLLPETREYFSRVMAAHPPRDGGGGSKAAPPKPGDIMDGHRFKGGDPSKKENWDEAS